MHAYMMECAHAQLGFCSGSDGVCQVTTDSSSKAFSTVSFSAEKQRMYISCDHAAPVKWKLQFTARWKG